MTLAVFLLESGRCCSTLPFSPHRPWRKKALNVAIFMFYSCHIFFNVSLPFKNQHLVFVFASGQWAFLINALNITVLTFLNHIMRETLKHLEEFHWQVWNRWTVVFDRQAISVVFVHIFHGIFYFEGKTFLEQWKMLEFIEWITVSWSYVMPMTMQRYSYYTSFLQFATWWRYR